MSKELLLVAEALSNEKGLSKEVVLEAVQAALEAATRKLRGSELGIRVALNSKNGEYATYQYWDVVSDDACAVPDRELTLTQALANFPHAKVGDRVETSIPSIEFGRIAAQVARNVMSKKVSEAIKNKLVDQYRSKMGQLIYGTVKKTTRDHMIVELNGGAEALLPRSEMLPQEMFRPNDRVRAYLYDIADRPHGPQMMISRTHTQMLTELFRIEVPEIGENVIEIKAAAREPGSRAKIAVKTNDGRIDPIGACVGMRGARVQAVSTELGGERVDIVLWDDNPAQFVINAMAPAEITSIVVDEDTRAMDLAVQPLQLAQAIGRNGQNVRLASQLTGWTLNVMTIEEFEHKNQAESNKVLLFFKDVLEIDEEIAQLLVAYGFSSLEEIAYVPKEELLAIEAFDEEIVEELRQRANDILLTQALTGKKVDAHSTLASLDGMKAEWLGPLAEKGITTVDALAEQSVDELLPIDGMTESKAGELIMNARASWFTNTNLSEE